jgi:DNA-binding GntR family transcriptional regulator
MHNLESSKLNRSQPAVPQIASDLRGRILSLELKPNAPLSRQVLQAEYNVSLTPIRDALQQLAEEGLVKVFPQAGTYVSPISLSRAYRGHFLRAAIEFELVRKLAEVENAKLVQLLRTIVAEQDAITADAGVEQFDRFERLDRKFHWTLFNAGQIEPLWETVRRHSGDIDRLRSLTLPRPGKMESIVAGHTAVVANLAKRSQEGAYQAMRTHLSETLSLAEAVRSAHPDYFVT